MAENVGRPAPPIRVLIAKPGLDGHDRGAKVVARALRDAGMEVVYTGIRQTPEMIAEAALQEDVEAIGLSILSGAHLSILPRVRQELAARGLGDVVLWVGGIVPAADVEPLRAAGVAAVFGPGSPLQETVAFVQSAVVARRAAAPSS
jgi:methylmalonyl-CoA mutase C-terminal domain/subunit